MGFISGLIKWDPKLNKTAAKFCGPNELYTSLNREFIFKNKKYLVVWYAPKTFFLKIPLTIFPLLLFAKLPFIGKKFYDAVTKRRAYVGHTGYLVLASDYRIIQNKDICKEVIRQYRIWETVFNYPFFPPNTEGNLDSFFRFETNFKKLIENIKYSAPESEEEQAVQTALKKLDADFLSAYPKIERFYRLLKQIFPYFYKISERPSDESAQKLLEKTVEFNEIICDLISWLDERKQNWLELEKVFERYQFYLEARRSFKLKLIISATLDLIPFSGTATTVMSETKKHLIDYLGGYEAINRNQKQYFALQEKLSDFLNLYETEVEDKLIRNP